MATSLKKLAAGIAAAAIAVSGFALGLGTANAEDDTSTANTAGTITLNNPNGDAAAHTYTAYLVAPYNDDYKELGETGYVNIDTFSYGDVAEAGAVEAALTAAGVETDGRPVKKALEGLIDATSIGTPWGYTDTTDPSKAVAAARIFADKLAKNKTFTESTKVTKAKLNEGKNTVTPAGLYLVLDTLTKGDSVNPASTQSVPMLVPSKIAGYEGLIKADNTDPVTVDGIINLKNTKVPVTKQVVQDDGTTPNNKPSYNIGDTVKFELTTTIPEYAGYDKDPKLGDNARVLKLIDTFQENANNNNKIPFSKPTVESVKIKRLANGQMTDVADITSSDAENANYVFTVTKAADNTTVNGATIDFGKLVNGAAGANATWKTGDVITVVLTATLNKDAFVTDKADADAATKTGCDTKYGNCNGVEVEFSNNATDKKSTVKGPDVNVYSFKLDVKKQYKKDEDASPVFLKNAQFMIFDVTNNNYLGYDKTINKWVTVDDEPSSTPISTNTVFDETKNKKGVFATDSNGDLSFKGLKAGKYTVTEIAAPNDYYQLALPSFTVEIVAKYDNDGTNKANSTKSGDDWLTGLTYTYTNTPTNRLVNATDNNSTVIVNNVKSFTELPKTGAAGIALFTIFGVVVLGAAGFFGIRARKAAKQIAQGA